MTDSADLAAIGYDVADSYRSGLLGHLAGKEWDETWANLLRELERRCPGFQKHEYNGALERGFADSR